MESTVFAFRVSKPVEPIADALEYSYDPQSQTTVWGGDGRAVAVKCCTVSWGRSCNAYGTYCTTYGSYRSGGQTCD